MNRPSGPLYSTVVRSHRLRDSNGLARPSRLDVVEDRGCRHKTRRDREPSRDPQPGRRRAMLSSLVGKAQIRWRLAHEPEVDAAG